MSDKLKHWPKGKEVLQAGRCEWPEKPSSLAAMPGSVRASVRLKISDWEELINFVTGDLHNMPHDDPNAQKMNTVLDAIRLSIVEAQNVRVSDLRD
jgi:hypothetical protein